MSNFVCVDAFFQWAAEFAFDKFVFCKRTYVFVRTFAWVLCSFVRMLSFSFTIADGRSNASRRRQGLAHNLSLGIQHASTGDATRMLSVLFCLC